MFQRSWCTYDWALTYAMVGGGFQQKGYHERPHTMSKGDDVCDMCWYAHPPGGKADVDGENRAPDGRRSDRAQSPYDRTWPKVSLRFWPLNGRFMIRNETFATGRISVRIINS